MRVEWLLKEPLAIHAPLKIPQNVLAAGVLA